ncbi:MAG: tetratricopeptide repeat protein [Flavipsychrobacter sp.]|nr:tetratricopeptide repeat protein [Flavipsychrobacter sp.]
MFEDDFNDDEWGPFEDTLHRYEQLRKGESSTILDEEEFERVIEYFFSSSNEEQALTACEIAGTYYPFSASILLLKAEILTQSQKYGQALRALDEMEQFDMRNLDAVLLRSDILMSQFRQPQAALWLEQQSENFGGKDKVEILLELSDVYDEGEDFDAVFNTLKRVIQIDRRNEEALQKICFWAEFTGRLDESVTIHTNLTDEDPYNALAWFNLGAAYQGLKLYEKAIDAYQFCVAIDEKFEFAYRNMADAFMRLRQYEPALEVLEKHMEIGKPEDVIFEAMGYCWEKKKDYTRARQYYRQASQLSPQDDSIFYKIGETYTREKQWEKAIKSFSVALHLDKDNASYCMAIGNCLMELDVKSEALVCYLNAVRLKPDNKTTWVSLVRGLYLAGYYDEAILQLQVATEHCGEKGDFHYFHAAALLEMGKAKEALLQLETALEMAPKKLKLFTELNPEFLMRPSVADLIAKYRKKK